MRQTIIISLFVFFLTHSVQFYAQNKRQEIENDIQKFSKILYQNPDSAKYYIDRAYQKSKSLNNDSLLGRSLYNIGYWNYNKANRNAAKKYIYEALEYSKKSGFNKITALSYNQLGTIAADENKFGEALKYYHLAYDTAEKHKLFQPKSWVLLNLGNLYLHQKDTLKGLEYYKENIANAVQNNLTDELLKGYMNLAVVYSGNDLNKATQNYTKALRIAEKYNDKRLQFDLYINISELYLGSKTVNALAVAKANLNRASQIQAQLHDSTLLFYLYFNYGGYYRKANNYPQAILYYKKALANKNEKVSSDQLINLMKYISDTYSLMGDYEKALDFKNLQYKLSDSVFTIKKNKDFSEIQTRYEVDKKNLKIKLLMQEKIIQKNRNQLLLVASAVLLILLLSVFFFQRQKIKNQRLLTSKENEIHLQEVMRLEQEKELRQIIGVVEGQDKERNRLAREIHDGIGGTLAGIKLSLSHYNTILNDKKIHDITMQLQDAFNGLRQISHDLSLNYLKGKSLYQLVTELFAEYRNRNEFQILFYIFPEKEQLDTIPENIKHQLYRVLQEVMANIAKHAQAQNVTINITRHTDSLNIIVEDDGRGFDPKNTNGIGIGNMQERLASVNGIFTIDSQPEHGTLITIDIPL